MGLKVQLLLLCGLLWGLNLCRANNTSETKQAAQEHPEREPSDIWVRPVEGVKSDPCWGFKNGIQVGLAPLGGPRGLLRVYATYTEQPQYKPYNFIAFEPVNNSNLRGYSELEQSRLDIVEGLRFWSGNSPDDYVVRYKSQFPAAGKVVWEKKPGTDKELEMLEVYVFCEPFSSLGGHQFADTYRLYVKLSFSADRPYEFALTTCTMDKIRDRDYLKHFILSATMGNYARLRQLYLSDGRVKTASQIWPEYNGDGFTDRCVIDKNDLILDKKNRYWLIASPDEEKPWEAEYAPGTTDNWIYRGQAYITQYWYSHERMAKSELFGQVNGRYCYWMSQSPIPGGIAFENVELVRGFGHGDTFYFGLYPGKPDELLRKIADGEY